MAGRTLSGHLADGGGSTKTASRRKPTRSGNKKLGQRFPADHLVVKPAVEQRRRSQGFTIRVPVTALLTSLFSGFVQFRAALVKASFYTQWQKTYGAEAWAGGWSSIPAG